MSDKHESIHTLSEGGIAAKHAARPTHPVLAGRTTPKEYNTIKATRVPLACWRLDDMRFEFDSSFILPEAAKELAHLAALRAAHPGAPLSIFGHADPVGDDEYNKQLSGRRAKAVYALLTRKTKLWDELYNAPVGGDHWGAKSIQVMLNNLKHYGGPVDGKMNQETEKAIQDFKQANGVNEHGLGQETRAVLFLAYMNNICIDEKGNSFDLTEKDFLAQGRDQGGKGDYQGCSEFNPLLIFSKADDERFKKDKDKTARNAANAPNRRVVVYLFQPGSQVDPARWPCPRASEATAGCRKRFWSDGEKRRSVQSEQREYEKTKDTFACRFYDRIANSSPCERVLRVLRIRLLDTRGQVLVGAPYRITIRSRQVEDVSDANGDAVLLDVMIPTTCLVEWSRPGVGRPAKARGEAGEGPSSREEARQEFAFLAAGGKAVLVREFEFEIEVFVDLADTDAPGASQTPLSEEGARRRLNNLGYSLEKTLEEQICSFQRDCGEKESGLLKDVEARLRVQHDRLRASPRASPPGPPNPPPEPLER